MSVPQVLAHQFDVNPVFDDMTLDDGPHIADAGGTLAVMAEAVFRAGEFAIGRAARKQG